MQKRHRVTDLPSITEGREPHELAALGAAHGAANALRSFGYTLTVRIENALVPARRAVVWRFHSVVSDRASRLDHTVVATWNSRERFLTVPGESPVHCDAPAEALAAGLAALARYRAVGRVLHDRKPKRKPSVNTYREPRTAGNAARNCPRNNKAFSNDDNR